MSRQTATEVPTPLLLNFVSWMVLSSPWVNLTALTVFTDCHVFNCAWQVKPYRAARASPSCHSGLAGLPRLHPAAAPEALATPAHPEHNSPPRHRGHRYLSPGGYHTPDFNFFTPRMLDEKLCREPLSCLHRVFQQL